MCMLCVLIEDTVMQLHNASARARTDTHTASVTLTLSMGTKA